jgi:hypothetical protein
MKTIETWYTTYDGGIAEGINIVDLLPFVGEEGYKFIFYTEYGEMEGSYIHSITIKYTECDFYGVQGTVIIAGEYDEEYYGVYCVEIYEDK